MNWTEEQVAAHQVRMAALKNGKNATPDASATAMPAPKAKAKPKPNAKGPNKTELRFERDFLAHRHFENYGFQRLTFLLAPDLRYTPDWVAWEESDFEHQFGILTCYEVKGAHVWDDARVKFLTARTMFPWVRWEAWQWKGGEWKELWTA